MEQLKRASLGRRIGSFFIDHVIVSMLVLGLTLITLGGFSELESAAILPAMLAAMGISYVLYCCKDIVGGRSAGKRLFGLGVRDEQGQVPSVGKRIVRNLFSFVWMIELLLIVGTRHKQKIGDRIVHTDVYVLPGKKGLAGTIIAIGGTVVMAFLLFIGGILYVIKQSGAYETATAYISSDPEIRKIVGEEMSFGFLPSGSVSISNGQGSAGFSIQVKGGKENIRVRISLTKEPGQDWIVNTIDYDK